LPKAQRCRFCDFQGIRYKCSPVLSWFFIKPNTLNHFTPFWRFENLGYSHLSAACYSSSSDGTSYLLVLVYGRTGFISQIHFKSGITSMSIEKADLEALRKAVELLEHPSLAARLTNMVGKPIELVGRALPAGASQAIATATTKSLEAAVKLSLLTIKNSPQESSRLLHKALAVASGAAGGAFGISSLPLELPVSTIIILRSILDIARSEGENLADPESALSCLEVLGLGARTSSDNAAKSDYFVIRGILAKSVTEAARFIAERGVIEEGSPVLVRLMTQIASRFGLVVTQKAAAQTIPIIGALGGAAVNYAFMDHFQAVGLGHFIVRRLERKYGKDRVYAAYERVRQDLEKSK
jgi:hypothetical protein